MTTTTAESIEILAQFESWREDTLLAGPDVSLTAYIKVLEAAEPDPRIAEVHKLAVAALDDPGARSTRDKDKFLAIAKLTDIIKRGNAVMGFDF